MHIQHTQTRIRIALDPIRLHRRPKQGLSQYEVRKLIRPQELRIRRKELVQQTLEREVVDLRVRVEEVEVDVDELLLGFR